MISLSALDILRHPQNYDDSDINEAIHCAVKALEKQIPKRPNRNEYGYFICPTCNSDDDSLMYDSNYAERYNYCHECGQALDWSDTE